MAIGKGLKIGIVLIAIIGVIVPITAVTLINIENERIAAWNELLDSDTRIVNITVDDVVVDHITYNRITQAMTPRYENVEFLQVKPGNTLETYNCTGIPLWDIIEYLDIDYGTADGVVLNSTDGYYSWYIPLNEIKEDKSKVLVCWERNDVNSTGLSYGPLYVAVNFSVTDPKPCSGLNAKKLGTISFIENPWNLTLFGDSILDENVTIPYDLTFTFTPQLMTITTLEFNYTDAESSVTNDYTGITLKNLFERSSGLFYDSTWSDWSSFRFVGQDGTTSPWMDKTDAMNNPNLYMLAWKKDAVALTYPGEGLFMGVVNYSVYQSTYPQGSDHFFIPNLVGIELNPIA